MYSTKKSAIISVAVGTLVALITLVLTADIIASINPKSTLVTLIGGCVDTGLIFSIGLCCTKINNKISFSDFKRKYPNINTDIDVESLEKELTKYRELKKVSKDIEKNREYFGALHSDEYNKMTCEEKIDVINDEIEFLSQEMILEKYKNNSIDDKPKTLKKTYKS